MSDEALVREWLRRAESNLAQARVGHGKDDILLVDLCFQAQQAAEKALKALCICQGIDFPRTHSIGQLLTLLAAKGCEPPPELNDVDALSEYAVTTRYPGDWDPVDEDEFAEALAMAEKVVVWVRNRVFPDED